MSSFKRRTPSKHVPLPPGTRTCPISTSTILTSSGIPSLDDILGGGVPLSCSLAILAPDPHSAYGELAQKYFVAQGVASGQRVCVVHADALAFASDCMWTPASRSNHAIPSAEEDEDTAPSDDKIKIAWRYEQMKKFETTVSDTSTGHFCETFDLSCRIPTSVIDEAREAKRLIPLNLTTNDDDALSSVDERLQQIEHVLMTTPSTDVVRLSITALGSPEWGDCHPSDLLRFLHALRRLLRRHPHACACITLAPHLCTDLFAGPGWVDKIGWATDAALSMTGFGANPALTSLFPSHHGLVQIHTLPAPHTILPTSDRHSTLRGLALSAGANVGTGENNLAFKCTRKRLLFETMHLDFGGGVAERRTTPSTMAIHLDAGLATTDKELAGVVVELEETFTRIKGPPTQEPVSSQDSASSPTAGKLKKAKKKVAFHSEKPDLYDF